VKVLENFKTWLKIQCCGPKIRCLFDPCIRDPGFGSGKTGVNIPDHNSESLEAIFGVKNTSNFFCGSGIRNVFDPVSGIRDRKNSDPVSRINWNIRDPQHCLNYRSFFSLEPILHSCSLS
jgi:hypothetical protein